MKGLTLHQPFATLVMAGVKCLETRSWGWHTAKPGTRIAIHSAKRIPSYARDAMAGDHFQQALDELDAVRRHEDPTSELLPLGCILGSVELLECVRTPDDPLADAEFVRDALAMHHPELGPHTLAAELAFGDFSPERWAWALGHPLPLDPPAPHRGWQRLWSVPARLEHQLDPYGIP